MPFYWRMETHLVSKTQSLTKCLNIQKFTGTPKDGKYYFYGTHVKNQIISNSLKFVPCFVIWISVAEHMKCFNACTVAVNSAPATMTSSECTISPYSLPAKYWSYLHHGPPSPCPSLECVDSLHFHGNEHRRCWIPPICCGLSPNTNSRT